MIPFAQQLIAVIFSLALVIVTVQLIRTHRLREEYALVWLAASLGIFLLSIFGGLVSRLAALFSVSYSPTLVLVAGLLFALVVLLSQSVVISSQADQMRDLAQSVALLEWRLRQMEGEQEAQGSTEQKSEIEQQKEATPDLPPTNHQKPDAVYER